MSDSKMFTDLPATFPTANKHKTPATAGALAFHVVLVASLILVPLALPQSIEQWRLLAMLAPAPPPPPPAPALITGRVTARPKPAVRPVERTVRLQPGAIVAPIEVPKEIYKVVEEGPDSGFGGVAGGIPGGVPGGVAGGTPGGVPGGVFGGLLFGSLKSEVPPPPPPVSVVQSPPPPPPPPPPPTKPVHVGGEIREPQLVDAGHPVYPPLARKARVQGTVVMEATLTTAGTVEEIRIVSGHPFLTEAAVDCVKQWRYTPTYLNGRAISVILTVRVNFILS